MARQKFNRFNQPRPCRMCGKLTTWSETNGNGGLDLCGACFEQASIENEHYDGLHDDAPHKGCAKCANAEPKAPHPAWLEEAIAQGFTETTPVIAYGASLVGSQQWTKRFENVYALNAWLQEFDMELYGLHDRAHERVQLTESALKPRPFGGAK